MNAVPLIFGLIVGNVLYQMFFPSAPNYGYAFNLSFHQAAAVAAYKIMEAWP
jgi:hypothetical protein